MAHDLVGFVNERDLAWLGTFECRRADDFERGIANPLALNPMLPIPPNELPWTASCGVLFREVTGSALRAWVLATISCSPRAAAQGVGGRIVIGNAPVNKTETPGGSATARLNYAVHDALAALLSRSRNNALPARRECPLVIIHPIVADHQQLVGLQLPHSGDRFVELACRFAVAD